MTDIQRHLGGILKILQAHVQPAQPSISLSAADLSAVRAEIAAFLPGSYGVAHGYIVNAQGATSEPVDILVYDKPLAAGSYDSESTHYHVEHVLLVVHVAVQHTEATFCLALQDISSVKVLRDRPTDKHKHQQTKPPGQQREKIPSHRLPVGLVYFNALEGFDSSAEDFFTRLSALIRHYPAEHQPDYIYAIRHQVMYRNPLLDGRSQTVYDMSLSRLTDLKKPGNCYICKTKYFRRHFFYSHLCIECGDFNYHKRQQHADLTGYIALVTGARVRIGYAAALRMLRAGAQVIVTTRFPHDAAQRYASESDFATWNQRLHIYGLDMRHLPSVEAFIRHLKATYPFLDILINNAAQTVRRPPIYYAHLIPFELLPVAQLPVPLQPLLGSTSALISAPQADNYLLPIPVSREQQSTAALSQIPLIDGDESQDSQLFPPGSYDSTGQQIDNRSENSWTMRLDEVPMPEMLEVQLINAVAPGLLVSQLKPLMTAGERRNRFIINVSSMEGQFAQEKRGIHPHTSMAKAALNMLTRSVAEDYAASQLYMNSVDPGWVSDQAPHTTDEERAANDQLLPIDMIDAAARLCDPIFNGLHADSPIYGKFLKDYGPIDW